MKKRIIGLMLLFIIVMAGLPGLCTFAQAQVIEFSAKDNIDGDIRTNRTHAMYATDSWASYTVNVAEEGYYSVTFTYSCLPYDTGNLGETQISFSKDEEELGTFIFDTDTSDVTKRVGYIKLSDGEQTIKFTAGSERGFKLSDVKLELSEPISIPVRAEQRIGARDYILSGAESESDAGATSGITNTDGSVSWKNGQDIYYLINIQKSGNYDFWIVSGQRSAVNVSVNDGEGSFSAPNSGDLSCGAASSKCTLALDAGDHIIKLSLENSQVSLFGLYIANAGMSEAVVLPASEEVTIEAENYNKTSGALGEKDEVLLLESGNYAAYDVDAKRSGEYEIKVCYNNLSNSDATVSLGLGNETYSEVLSVNGTDYTETSIEGVILESGKSTLNFLISESDVSFDYIKIRRTGNLLPDLLDEIMIEAEEYIGAENTEIDEIDGEQVVAFVSESSTTYGFNALDDATYQIKFNAINNTVGKVTVLYDDDVLCEKNVISKGNDFDDYIICNVNVASGKHTFKIVSDGFSGKVDTITVKKLVISDSGEVEGETIGVFDSVSASQTGEKDSTYKSKNPDYPLVGLYVFRIGNWISFDVNIPKTGKYEISAIAGAKNECLLNVSCNDVTISGKTKNTGEYGFPDEAVLGELELQKGTQNIVLAAKQYDMYFFGIIIRPINQTLETQAVTSGDIVIANDTVLQKGTSEIDIKFTAEVEEAGNISLESENGEFIPLVTKITANTVKVYLCEALKDDTSYVLSVSDTKNIYGGVLAEEKYSFTTGGEDYAEDKAFLTNIEKTDDKVTLSYVVKTSADVGIKGRNFKVTAKDPAGDLLPTQIFSGETDTDGVVTVTHRFTQNDMSGMYTFIAESEYTSQNPILTEVHFISESGAKELLGILKGTTEDNVGAFFEENERELGINIEEDMGNIDASRVYVKFAGKEFENFDEFREMYSKAVFAETVNQAMNLSVIETLLADSETYEITGIKKDKIDIILANDANQLAIRILGLNENSDHDSLIESVSDIVDNELLKTTEKSDLTLKDAEISIHHGEAITIPIDFNETEENIESIVIKIKSDDTSFNKEMVTASVLNNGDYSYKWDNNILSVVFTYEKLAKLGLAGNVVLLPSDTQAEYNISVSGEVFYNESLNEIYDISENILVKGKIAEKTYSVEAYKRQQSGSGNGSSGGTISTSSNGTISGNARPIPQKSDETSKSFEFTDINGVEWAKESINELLKLGIVSESTDGCFNPNDNITREQFVKLVVEAVGMTDETAKTSLRDVAENAWYYKYISSAEKSGMVTGSDGMFGVGNYITREDMAVIIKRAMELKGIAFPENDAALFEDDNVISGYAKTAVYGLKEFNIINGTGGNYFTPKGNATRAQAAKIIYEMIKVVNV